MRVMCIKKVFRHPLYPDQLPIPEVGSEYTVTGVEPSIRFPGKLVYRLQEFPSAPPFILGFLTDLFAPCTGPDELERKRLREEALIVKKTGLLYNACS
jgi:hypothetical protein